MNSSPAMHLISFLSRVALVGVATLILGLAFNAQPLALLAFALGTLFLMIVASDYAPAQTRRVAVAATVIDFPVPAHRENLARLVA